MTSPGGRSLRRPEGETGPDREARSPVLRQLAAELRAGNGLLAGATVDPPVGADDAVGASAAAGARTADPADGYALVVEAVHEGHRLHAGTGRLLDGADPDLALLAGDHLYAFGLDRLARLGDLASVAALAGVIAEGARAQAEERPERAARAWVAGAAAIAACGGPGPERATDGDRAHARSAQAPSDRG